MQIDIGRGFTVLVDDEYAYLADLAWCRKQVGRKGHTPHIYAARNEVVDGRKVTVYMHRLIAQAPPGVPVDHINRNTLDNRQANLRVADRFVNARNRSVCPWRTSTGVLGVSRHGADRFDAYIKRLGRSVWLGRFLSLEAAAAAVAAARLAIDTPTLRHPATNH